MEFGEREAAIICGQRPPEPVLEVQERLKKHYLDSLGKTVIPDWGDKGFRQNLEELQLSLRLAPSDSRGKTSQKVLIQHLLQPCSLQDKLLKGLLRRVLVEGDLGYGKTSLCMKLAYDWAKGESSYLSSFQLVFLIQLRFFHGKLSSYIKKEFFPKSLNSKKARQSVKTYMDDYNDKVLFVLDGFDELDEGNMKEILELMEGTLYPNSHVLVTSLPACTDLLKPFVEKRVVVQGLGLSYVRPFVYSYFKSVNKVDEAEALFQKGIVKHETYSYIMASPLMCFLMCRLFEVDPKFPENSLTKAMESLLQEVFLKSAPAAAIEGNGEAMSKTLSEKNEAMLKTLGRLALQVVLDNKASVTEDEIRNEGLGTAVERGLLVRSWALGKRGKKKSRSYRFIHECIMAYLAARYMGSLSSGKFDKSLVLILTYVDTMDDLNDLGMQVLRFLAGTLGGEAGIIFQRLKFSAISMRTLFILLKESGSHPHVITQLCDLANVRSKVQVTVDDIELDGWKSVVESPACKVHAIDIVFKDSRGYDQQKLESLIRAVSGSDSIRKVRISTSVHHDFQATTVQHISRSVAILLEKKNLECLDVSLNRLEEDEGLRPVLKAVISALLHDKASHSLQKLVMNVGMSTDMAVSLCRAIQAFQGKLQVLSLPHLVCGQEAYQALASLIRTLPMLALNLNHAWTLSPAVEEVDPVTDSQSQSSWDTRLPSQNCWDNGRLQSPTQHQGPWEGRLQSQPQSCWDNGRVQSQSQGNGTIRSVSSIDAGTLRKYNTLRKVNYPLPVCDSKEHDMFGFHDIFTQLQSPDCRLQNLNLSNASLRKEDFMCLGETLQKAKNLTSLTLQGVSKVPDILPLFLGLQENVCLQLLDLSSSHVTLDDFSFQCLCQVLTRAANLRLLSLKGWSFQLEEPRSMDVFRAFLASTNMSNLDLEGCDIQLTVDDSSFPPSEDIQSALNVNEVPSLTFLNLKNARLQMRNNRRHDVFLPPRLASFLSPFQNLVSLDCGLCEGQKCPLDDKGAVKAFTDVKQLPKLKQLGIAGWTLNLKSPGKTLKSLGRCLKSMGIRSLDTADVSVRTGLGKHGLETLFFTLVLGNAMELQSVTVSKEAVASSHVDVLAKAVADKFKGDRLELVFNSVPDIIFHSLFNALNEQGRLNVAMSLNAHGTRAIHVTPKA